MNKKKKILFLINKLNIGGAERVFVQTAKELIKRDFDVHFAFLFGDKSDQILLSELNLLEDKIFYCHANSFYDISSVKLLSDFLRENNIDCVYSTLNEANIFARFLKFFNYNISLFIREANVANKKPIQFKFIDILLNFFVKKIICVSEDVKKSLLSYQPFFSDKMVILSNGVEVSNFKKIYKMNNDSLKLLNVASLTVKKGQGFLIEACGLVSQKRKDFYLTIIGGGPEKNNLLKKIKSLDLEKNVFILDQVFPEKLSEYYINSDLFILSSVWEGCPNVLLEAMGYGLPVISTKVSGANDIIKDGISGKLVKISDAKSLAESILWFLNNKDSLSIFGIQARERIMKYFSMDIYMVNFIDLIK